VGSGGEIVFNLPSNADNLLAARSQVIRLPSPCLAPSVESVQAASARKWWEAVKPGLFTGLRAAFGVGLFASLLAVYSTIFFISSSSSSSDEDRRDDRRREPSFMPSFGPSLYFGPSPFDIFYYRPYYSYQRQGQQSMGLLESVYSYVFGDGDPNTGLDDLGTDSLSSD